MEIEVVNDCSSAYMLNWRLLRRLGNSLSIPLAIFESTMHNITLNVRLQGTPGIAVKSGELRT